MPWRYREVLYPTPSPSAEVEPASGHRAYLTRRQPILAKPRDPHAAEQGPTGLWATNARHDQVSPASEIRAGT